MNETGGVTARRIYRKVTNDNEQAGFVLSIQLIKPVIIVLVTIEISSNMVWA